MLRYRLNRAQRIVIVVALGLALYFVGAWLTGLGSHLPYGSVTYTNLNSGIIVGGLHPWVKFIIWLVLIAILAVASLALLRTSSADREGPLKSKYFVPPGSPLKVPE
jgi:hypothetical protein